MRFPCLFLLLLAAAGPLAAQSTGPAVSAPASGARTSAATELLLERAQAWGRHSRLGDLAAHEIGTGDIELRYWGGFGVTGTVGLVLRRVGGVWEGWRVDVVPCLRLLDPAVADTMSRKTRELYEEDTREKCPAEHGTGVAIRADTLAFRPLKASLMSLAWDQLVGAGVPILPRSIPRTWQMPDGYTHVVELRIGKLYRASAIECAFRPEGPDDFRVQKVAGVLARIFPEARIGCTR